MADVEVTVDERFDSIDRGLFQEMLESPSFKILQRRVAREIERAMTDSSRGDELREVYRAQGAVRMGQTVLGLPAVILREMTPAAQHLQHVKKP